MSAVNDCNQFIKAIDIFLKEWDEDKIDLIVRRTAMDMHTRVVMRTPFDTGNAAGNWKLTLSKLKGETRNNTQYIMALENGHSGQAPHGFAAITINEIAAELKQVFKDGA